MSKINVKSEIGKLKKVLLHRPGAETENMTPDTYEELLFEDAFFMHKAQEEHDAFASVFTTQGVEVVYIEQLIAHVFTDNKTAKARFLKQFTIEAGIETTSSIFARVMKYYESFDSDFNSNKELVDKIIAGVRFTDLPETGTPTLGEMTYDELFVLPPMPNLLFQRDPFTTIGNGISLHTMKKFTRKRETIFAEYLFEYHADFKGTKRYFDRYEPNATLEGGDIMILSDEVIAVGISDRTSADAVEKLAQNIFADKSSSIKTIYGIDIPKGRAWMHLDTVFTQVDIDKFSIFSNYRFDIYKITKSTSKTSVLKTEKLNKSIDAIMKDVFGKKVKLFHCGNKDPLISSREQWNDGSNVLAIAPNEIIAYDRNYVTNEMMKKAGVIVHEIPSSELSRGRGGPRCMSMPLVREDIFGDAKKAAAKKSVKRAMAKKSTAKPTAKKTTAKKAVAKKAPAKTANKK